MDTKPNSRILQLINESPLISIQDMLEVVDAETVYKLMKHFGGTQLSIPKLDKFLKNERNLKVKEDFYNGVTLNQLAQKYGLSTRQITNIIDGGTKNG